MGCLKLTMLFKKVKHLLSYEYGLQQTSEKFNP